MDRRVFLEIALWGPMPIALGLTPSTVFADCGCGEFDHSSDYHSNDDWDGDRGGADSDYRGGRDHGRDTYESSPSFNFSFLDQRERAASGSLLGVRDLRDDFRDLLNDIDSGLRLIDSAFDRTYADETIGLISDGIEISKFLGYMNNGWGLAGKVAVPADVLISSIKTYADWRSGQPFGQALVFNFTPLDELLDYVVRPGISAISSAYDTASELISDSAASWFGPHAAELQKNIEGLYHYGFDTGSFPRR